MSQVSQRGRNPWMCAASYVGTRIFHASSVVRTRRITPLACCRQTGIPGRLRLRRRHLLRRLLPESTDDGGTLLFATAGVERPVKTRERARVEARRCFSCGSGPRARGSRARANAPCHALRACTNIEARGRYRPGDSYAALPPTSPSRRASSSSRYCSGWQATPRSRTWLGGTPS